MATCFISQTRKAILKLLKGLLTFIPKVLYGMTNLGNVLVTDDLHIVLCGFDGSCVNPDRWYEFDTSPPLPYVCPIGYTGIKNKR
jgi:hypothetical protein